MLSRYKYILWDFDGVILNSNPARTLGFKKVLEDFPNDQVEKLLDFHNNNGGLSRYVKFRYLYEVIRGEEVDEHRIQDLANQFSLIMKQILTNPQLLIQDSVSFIQQNCSQIQMHIVSGSDGQELRFLCDKLGISNFFKSISGSPISKTDLVKDLIDRKIIENKFTCLIGDAINDYDAAKSNNIDFFGYNNLKVKDIGSGYIQQFDCLKKNTNNSL
jgi:phosphoglycolate phosphatase-like HAD superfamily hydrolase